MNRLNYNRVFYYGLKLALSFAFFSAVADRFGLWGAAGSEGVFWGNFDNFISYTKLLNPWAPAALVTILAWFVTILEVVLGLALLTNIKTKEVAFVSGVLLAIFGLAMIFTLGVKPVFDYSVFSAAFGAFYLSTSRS
ncbi:hypothetical protein [Halobacteriovorax sp. DA5]|uniref:hypothetical protein n=1 Tax=Halobacteriovorax sp. DA5 TaxID=2067553 RepID=UPI000CD133A6|nr:hypothetical protein [Halobacteriovorax sp. DA5]POB12544.1 hypothetical protein C0Z22_14560 [Halobacteriovorax sp. DA5]